MGYRLLLGALFFVSACSGKDDGCGDNEVKVAYLGTSNDRSECKPIPAECGGNAECGVMACIAAMYGLCEDPAYGAGCSDTYPPTIISCND